VWVVRELVRLLVRVAIAIALGLAALQAPRHPEDPRLNPVAVFAITGLALLAVGLVL
jgi:hypothetical protein